MNVAGYLSETARTEPERLALAAPQGTAGRAGNPPWDELTFAGLQRRSDRYAWGLRGMGVKPGMRALLMVRPGLDFIALTFALFAMGVVPVLIDPGMGWKRFLRCVGHVAPHAFLGIPLAHALKFVFPKWFRSVEVSVVLGRKRWLPGFDIARIPDPPGPFPAVDAQPDDLAAILFTTGSTGPAKGVEYTHRIFDTQIELLREQYGLGPDDTDLPCFPLFALFSTALGAAAVIPEMNPSKPARVDPRRIVEAVTRYGCTYSFGSPALWRPVSQYCERENLRLPTLRKVFMAGAPVPITLHERMYAHVLVEGAEVHTPYGATEALPVADFTGSEVLRDTRQATRSGAGTCVGRPVRGAEVRIVRIIDEPIAEWREDLCLPAGQIGEIVVKGPMVTPRYFRDPDKTALAKIRDGAVVRHRMGDLGRFDDAGRLWFLGRTSHRVETPGRLLPTVCCEAIFNEHPSVYRTALVGLGALGRQRPVLVVELLPGTRVRSKPRRHALIRELRKLGAANPLTANIETFLFHPGFPVDIRHNAKIGREQLREWAAREIVKRSGCTSSHAD